MQVRKVIGLAILITLGWITEISAQCGTENIVIGKTITTSSVAGGNVGNNIKDGVHTTYWQPMYSSGNYAYVDLASDQTVCRVVVKWRYGQAASSFKIQMTSTPGTESSWVDIYSETNNNPTDETTGPYSDWVQVNSINITSTSNTNRYIRILVGSIEYASWTLSEFQVFKSNSNALPSASMTNPSTNIIIPVSTPLSLTANALDPDGSVTQVVFKNGATVLATVTQPTGGSYVYSWTPTVTGTYAITATATDNLGATGESLPVTVTVIPASGGWSLGGNATTGLTDPYLGTSDQKPLILKTWGAERMRITEGGKVLIGTGGFPTGAPSNALLAVKGQIWTQVLKVTQLNWPDYVFEKDYTLMPLPELATYIKKHKHLPGVPSVVEVNKEGINVGENQAILLKKIEELTLYLIEQNKKIDVLQKQINQQQGDNKNLKKVTRKG